MLERTLQANIVRSIRSQQFHWNSESPRVICRAIWRLLAIVSISLFAVAAQAVDSRTICGVPVTADLYTDTTFPNWLDGTATIWAPDSSGYNIYLGKISADDQDPYSILNQSGMYGSSSGSNSIFNSTSWGSTSLNVGVCNPYAPNYYAPIIYQSMTTPIGYLRIDPFYLGYIDPVALVAALLKKKATSTVTTTTITTTTTTTTSAAATTTTTSSVTTTTQPSVSDATPSTSSITLAYVGSDHWASNSVSVIDTAARSVVTTVPTGSQPGYLAVNATGTRAYASNYSSGTLSVMDTQSNLIVSSLAPGPYPAAVAVSPDGSRLYVAANTSRISVFDTSDNKLLGEIDTGSQVRAIALNPSGTRLYAVGNSISVIDTATNLVVANIAVASGNSLAINRQGTRLYVSNGSGSSASVSVIDTDANTVIQTVSVSAAKGIAVNSAGTRVYAANYGSNGTLSVIDASANHAVIATVATGPYPETVAITPDDRYVFVGNDNGVTVVDTATNTVAGNIALTSRARGIAFVQFPTAFVPQFGAALNTALVSNAITVSGANGAAAVSISGGQYEVSTNGGGTWSGFGTPPAAVNNGDQIRVQLTSSGQTSTTTSAALNIGGVNSAFYVTTRGSGDIPDGTLMTYTYHASLPLAAAIESDMFQIKGLGAGIAVPLRITRGEYCVSTDNHTTWSAWSSANGSTSVKNDDWVKVRGTTGNVPGQTVPVELRAGGQTWVQYLTTQPADLTSLSIAGPASVNAGETSAYTASATWTYGATLQLAKTATPGTTVTTTVTPAWSTGGAAASIGADGVLTAGAVATNSTVPVTASYEYGGIQKAATYDVTIVGNGGIIVTSTTSTTTSTTATSPSTTTASTTTTTLGGTSVPVTLNFTTGWNLVGNSADASLDVATAFGDSTKVSTVWKWVADGAKWAFYAPSLVGQALADYAAGKGYEVLSAIAGGEGFWVNAKATFTAQLPAGTAISSAGYRDPTDGTGRLVKGWNLIAIGDNKTPSEFNKALSAVPPEPTEIPLNNLTTLWAWDSTQTNWYFYAPSLEKNGGLGAYIQQKSYLDFGTKALDPSTGFWVNKP